MAYLVAIDVGKTNLRVGVFNQTLARVERWSVSSSDVPAAQQSLQAKLLQLEERLAIDAVGISVFGPLQVDSSASDFGAIIESSEPAWSGVNIPRLVCDTCRSPVYCDYDVNAGALAEALAGAGRGTRSFVYLSIGTGVGGVLFRERLTPGYAPQLGHMYLPQEEDDGEFSGSCRFHGRCLQGLASGRAMELRWGRPAETLEPEHPAWSLESRYLARACANLVYTFSPDRIVLASSVGCTPGLSARVNDGLRGQLNGFLEPELRALYARQAVVVSAQLAQDSSLVGSALLARERLGLRMR